jgi:hypothetical protein
MCHECGVPVLADDCPGAPIPPYTCPSCGATFPPTPGEESARLLKTEEYAKHTGTVREEIAKRKAAGLPLIWTEASKTTREQRAAARKAERAGEREIDEILSSKPKSHLGRKSDSAYDKADYRMKIAQISGKKIPIAKLADQILAADKSSEGFKIDKLRQAIKRRNPKRKP